jgi:muconolactone delta-isomerase
VIGKIFANYIAQQQWLSQNFINFAEQQTPAPIEASQRAAETRREKVKAKALQERADLFRLWKQRRHEQFETLLAEPHGERVRELLAFLRTMSLDDGPQLVEFVRAAGWHRTDPDTRFEILALINAAITALREQHDLPPFDHGIPPDEEPTAFVIIRELFR